MFESSGSGPRRDSGGAPLASPSKGDEAADVDGCAPNDEDEYCVWVICWLEKSCCCSISCCCCWSKANWNCSCCGWHVVVVALLPVSKAAVAAAAAEGEDEEELELGPVGRGAELCRSGQEREERSPVMRRRHHRPKEA